MIILPFTPTAAGHSAGSALGVFHPPQRRTPRAVTRGALSPQPMRAENVNTQESTANTRPATTGAIVIELPICQPAAERPTLESLFQQLDLTTPHRILDIVQPADPDPAPSAEAPRQMAEPAL